MASHEKGIRGIIPGKGQVGKILHLLFFSACDGAVRGDVISILQGKATSRLVYILPGMFIFRETSKRNFELKYNVRKCY